MQIQYLREYVELVDTQSFTMAARILQTTQTALTRHLKRLEQELDVVLIARTTRSMELTPVGKRFYRYCKRTLAVYDEMNEALEKHKMEIGGVRHLRIGLLRSYTAYGISDCCLSFAQLNPNVTYDLQEAEGSSLIELLNKGECDVGFDVEPDGTGAESGEFERVTFARDQLIVIVPSDHALAAQPNVSMAQLAGENFVMMPAKSSSFGISMRACENAGIRPNVIFNMLREGDCVHMVADHMGVSLGLERPTKDTIQRRNLLGVKMLPLQPQASLEVNMIYRKDHATPLVRDLARHFQSCAVAVKD